MGLRNRNLYSERSCFFVTTSCNGHLQLLLPDNRKQILADSLEFIRKKYEIQILGYVIMPNHLHILLNFSKENRLSDAMRDFKKFTSTQIRKDIESNGNLELLENLRLINGQHVFKVWQDRFDDVWIGKKLLLETKLEYIHLNPLQPHWNLAARPENYFFSSAAFYEGVGSGPVEVTDYREVF